MLRFLPLVFAIALVAILVLPTIGRRGDLVVSQIAIGLFGKHVANSPRKRDQVKRLRAAHHPQTHRQYASRTLLYSGIMGVAGGIIGVYLAAFVTALLELTGDQLPGALSVLADLAQFEQLDPSQLFVVLLLSSATVGLGLLGGTYWFRWYILEERAKNRAAAIEASLPRTVSFIYALSRSGMAFPRALSVLSKNEAVYGEAARELGVAVTDMNTFGTDVLTALDRLSERSPSDGMSEFAENLSSVVGSGRELSEFLKDQYEQLREEAASRQRQYLELLSAFAEIYVTVLVAGVLFFITVLSVIGFVLEDTLGLIRFITYVAIPLATAGFVVYVDSATTSLRIDTIDRRALEKLRSEEAVPDRGMASAEGDDPTRSAEGDVETISASASTATQADGGTVRGADGAWERNRERLAAYDRISDVYRWLRQPGTTLVRNPWSTALLTVPLAMIWIVATARPVPLDLLGTMEVIATPLVEGTIVVLGTYALVYEYGKRQRKRIEAQVPDFLDRLASSNNAGMTVIESIRRVTESDLGALSPELDRAWQDIELGADVKTALDRMERRIDSPAVTRAIVLVGNTMRSSGDLGPVVEIAAEESRATERLRRERRSEMLTYLVVIYIAFFVFLGIIGALVVSFVPALEAAAGAVDTESPGATGAIGVLPDVEAIDVDAYLTTFYHVSLVQAVCSGLVAGQLGEGSLRDGVKHATVLLTIAYVVFLFI